jgi:hypothetical protein
MWCMELWDNSKRVMTQMPWGGVNEGRILDWNGQLLSYPNVNMDSVRFEFLTVMIIKCSVFRDIILCSLLKVDQHFRLHSIMS